MDQPSGPLPAEPSSAAARAPLLEPRSALSLSAQLLLLAAVARVFRVEGFELIAISIPAFLVHAHLPLAARKPFLVLLFAGTLFFLFGWEEGLAAAGVVAVSLGWLLPPLPFPVRVVGLAATWGILAFLRARGEPLLLSSWNWGIVASLFLFRAIVYLYDLRHLDRPPPWRDGAAYFCLFPNLFGPLFPVVDFKTFQRTCRTRDGAETARTGVGWMWRGVFHLLLYRLVSTEGVLAPAGVRSPGELLRFLACNYLLYLQVSGKFHLAVGCLRLFGFELPPTNRNWLLASGFTDFWRRINIYWKDFMQKVFFYPAYFAFRRAGPRGSLALATVVVFVATWALHSLQWFWIRGSLLLRRTDVLFWTVLAALVLVNVLREGRSSAAWKAAAGPARKGIRAGLCTAGTLASILLLWSLWTSASFASWLELLRFWD